MKIIRGAITADCDSKEAIFDATIELFSTIIDKHNLAASNIVSIVFSCTHDLTKAYPAQAVRQMGYNSAPLMCLQEMYVENSLPLCIRVMLTVKGVDEVHHCYLRAATSLRSDL